MSFVVDVWLEKPGQDGALASSRSGRGWEGPTPDDHSRQPLRPIAYRLLRPRRIHRREAGCVPAPASTTLPARRAELGHCRRDEGDSPFAFGFLGWHSTVDIARDATSRTGCDTAVRGPQLRSP